jgi:hypothetical protein
MVSTSTCLQQPPHICQEIGKKSSIHDKCRLLYQKYHVRPIKKENVLQTVSQVQSVTDPSYVYQEKSLPSNQQLFCNQQKKKPTSLYQPTCPRHNVQHPQPMSSLHEESMDGDVSGVFHHWQLELWQ